MPTPASGQREAVAVADADLEIGRRREQLVDAAQEVAVVHGPEYPSRVASRVEIIERRRLVVGDREIDLAALVPEGGGPATQELDASPGGSKVDEAVVLGTPRASIASPSRARRAAR